MTAALTTRESCARLIEHAARGHIAHECGWLRALAAGLRKLPLTGTETSSEVILAAVRTLHEIAKTCGEDTPNGRLITEVRDRILFEVSTDDPMEPYNDKAKWWPHAQAA